MFTTENAAFAAGRCGSEWRWIGSDAWIGGPAVILPFYAITLNWGRIAQYKTITTVAANVSAAQMGAMLASYGEYQLQTLLDGENPYCKWASLLEIVITAIIIIIIVVLTIVFAPNAALTPLVIAALTASTVLAIVSIAIEVAVIQPGLSTMWNKLQVDAPIEDRIVEQGVQLALQAMATDNVQVPDQWDYDNDGRFATSQDRKSTRLNSSH